MLRQTQLERDEAGRLLLHCHPETLARNVASVSCEWSATDDDEVLLTFTVTGAATLVIPQPASPGRADGLWRTTCFELFWRPIGSPEYFELNLSPSGRWAAYAFEGYRAGVSIFSMAVAPHIETSRTGDQVACEIDVDFAAFPAAGALIGLSAVIEETDGTISYWALRHPPGPPDFHHPDCFALELPAVAAP